MADPHEDPWERWINAVFLVAGLAGVVAGLVLLVVGPDRWGAVALVVYAGLTAVKVWSVREGPVKVGPMAARKLRRLVGRWSGQRSITITLSIDGKEVTATGPDLERVLRDLHDQQEGRRPAVADDGPETTGPASVE